MSRLCLATGSPVSDARDVEGNWGLIDRGVEMMVAMDVKNECAKMILIWNKIGFYIFVLYIFCAFNI